MEDSEVYHEKVIGIFEFVTFEHDERFFEYTIENVLNGLEIHFEGEFERKYGDYKWLDSFDGFRAKLISFSAEKNEEEKAFEITGRFQMEININGTQEEIDDIVSNLIVYSQESDLTQIGWWD